MITCTNNNRIRIPYNCVELIFGMVHPSTFERLKTKAKITDRETHWQRRRVKEAIRIQKSQVRMNLDQGIVLHQAWRRFNIHTSCFSHSAEGHMTGSGNGGKNPL